MKRIWLVVLLVISAAWLSGGILSAAAEQGLKAPDAEMIIAGEKKSARFSHPVHLDLGVTCGQCHHGNEHQPLTVEDITAMEDGQQLLCANCHNKDFAVPELQTLKDIYHARCKECHVQGVNGKTGPTKCTDCHVK